MFILKLKSSETLNFAQHLTFRILAALSNVFKSLKRWNIAKQNKNIKAYIVTSQQVNLLQRCRSDLCCWCCTEHFSHSCLQCFYLHRVEPFSQRCNNFLSRKRTRSRFSQLFFSVTVSPTTGAGFEMQSRNQTGKFISFHSLVVWVKKKIFLIVKSRINFLEFMDK